MSLDDRQLEAREQALGEELRASFAGLSLTAAQHQRLQDRFRQHIAPRRQHSVGSAKRPRDVLANGSGYEFGRREDVRLSTRQSRFSHGLELAAVVIVLLLFVGGIFVAHTLVPGKDSSRPGTSARPVTSVYAVEGFHQQLLSLDPQTLADQTGGTINLSTPLWTISADGSTVASATYRQDADLVTISSGFIGTERTQFKSPVQGRLQTLQRVAMVHGCSSIWRQIHQSGP